MSVLFPASCDLLVTADYVLTQDAERRTIDGGAVAVTGGRIAALGTREDAAATRAAERLELGNALLMPGLVNAHTHVAMTAFRGLADDLPLMQWLTTEIFPREEHLTPEIVELGALLGCAEMIRTGTTAFQDMYLYEDATAKAAEASGLRCLLGEGIFASGSKAFASLGETYDLVRDQARRFAAHPRVRIGVMPHAVYTTTPEILEVCRDLAAELGTMLHIHLSETAEEVAQSLDLFGQRPVAYARERGILGPRTSIAHGVVLNDEELDLLAETGTRVVHNPGSNMKLASGVAPVPGMLERGMLPGLGTDGASSNNSLNMVMEMRACALLHKVDRMDPAVCGAQGVLDMATLGGAAALGWEGLGSLAAGAPADMIALDCASPNLLPMYSPASHLAYAATGHEVRMTMVEGAVLYLDGAYRSLDYPAVVDEAKKLKAWALAKR